jgi:uncharacterized membrane protein
LGLLADGFLIWTGFIDLVVTGGRWFWHPPDASASSHAVLKSLCLIVLALAGLLAGIWAQRRVERLEEQEEYAAQYGQGP